MRLVSTHLEDSCRFYKLWNDSLKAPFVFLFPDAVTCAFETKALHLSAVLFASILVDICCWSHCTKASDIVVSEFTSIDRTQNDPVSFRRLILQHDQTYQIRVLAISRLTGLCRLMGIYVWDENLAAVLAVATFTPPMSGSGDVVHK